MIKQGANQSLVPLDTKQDPPIKVTTFIVHTAVSRQHGDGPEPSKGNEWHFYIDEDGTVWQRRDTAYQADAQHAGNAFAISVETWDNADPDNTPFTPAQIEALVDLGHWALASHGIPRQVCTAWDSGGLGYHRMFKEWNKNKHSCPTNTRAHQLETIIFPRILGEVLPAQPPPPAVPAQPTLPQVMPAPPFPLQPGHWFGLESRDRRNHSGYWVGDRPHIATAQQRLKDRGWGITVDGGYGPQTDGIIRQFQAEKGLKIDGLLGPITWRALWEAPIT